MTTLLQPGNHPDPHPGPDQLNAFAENALPLHEQQQTLAHLATCPDCRNLVYLAQQANPIEILQPQPIPAHRAWFASWKLAFPAAFALAALIFVTVHLHNNPIPHTPPTTASVEQTPPIPQPTPAAPATATPIAETVAPPAPAQALPDPRKDKTQPQPMLAAADAVAAAPPPTPQSIPTPLPTLSIQRQMMAGSSIHGSITTPDGAINGRITDPSGASVPRAKITATNTLTGVAITRESTNTGDFSISALDPGNYNVEAQATGFQRRLQENVRVEPSQNFALNMKLTVGGDNQTVTVSDAPPSLDTTNATLGGTIENELYTNLPLTARGASRAPTTPRSGAAPVQSAKQAPQQTDQDASSAGLQQGVYGGTGQANLSENYIEGVPASNVTSASAAAAQPATINSTAFALATKPKIQPTLPSHLPALSTVTNARQALAIDTAGALYRSEDAGVTWKPIATQWKGRATRLALAHPSGLGGGQAMAKSGANTVAAAPQPTPQTFELTTDTNATYTSTDGQTWHLK